MEQTKAKTAKEISVAAYIYANENWSDDFRKISAHSYMAGYIAAQSHIANLEAEKADLEHYNSKLQGYNIIALNSAKRRGLTIKDLKAQNKELREALDKSLDLLDDLTNACHYLDRKDEYYDVIQKSRLFYELEAALKEDKQDGS